MTPPISNSAAGRIQRDRAIRIGRFRRDSLREIRASEFPGAEPSTPSERSAPPRKPVRRRLSDQLERSGSSRQRASPISTGNRETLPVAASQRQNRCFSFSGQERPHGGLERPGWATGFPSALRKAEENRTSCLEDISDPRRRACKRRPGAAQEEAIRLQWQRNAA